MSLGWRICKLLLTLIFWPMLGMPGRRQVSRKKDHQLNDFHLELKARLLSSVKFLAEDCGPRNKKNRKGLDSARQYIHDSFASLGYTVSQHEFDCAQGRCANVIAEKRGKRAENEIVVIGAHYDTVFGSPGADDNASGVAVLIELARALAEDEPRRTVRFVAFANEEHPEGPPEDMGSYLYAKSCHDLGERIVSMISLEMLGYFSSEIDSQNYPKPFVGWYPSTADFIGFFGNLESRKLVRRCIQVFRDISAVPSEGLAAPDCVKDVGRSDHWGFWVHGFPALMITDTAEFRYPHYHTASDTVDKLDFDRLTLVTHGLVDVVRDLVRSRQRFSEGILLKLLEGLFDRGFRLVSWFLGRDDVHRRNKVNATLGS